MSSDADPLILPALPRAAPSLLELVFCSLSEADRGLGVRMPLADGWPVEGLSEARPG
ncbi:MAG: hypothetical protein GX621_02740 [Pirellulaceae bacterium]|nr:hypothetical protein [Pirellulaceae bacterium]